MKTILSILAFISFNWYICELPQPDWHQSVAEILCELLLLAMICVAIYCDVKSLINYIKNIKK